MNLWKQIPLWIMGFCCAILPGLFLASVSLQQVGPTHAVGWGQLPTQVTGIRSISTHQALIVDSTVVDAGNRLQGEEIDLQIQVHNIWTRELSVTIQLHSLPGWKAHMDQSRLLPGESTVVHLTTKAGAPGEVDGYVEIAALDDFLNLQVAVKGQIAAKPKPNCPDELHGAPDDKGIPGTSPQAGPSCQEKAGGPAPAEGSGKPTPSPGPEPAPSPVPEPAPSPSPEPAPSPGPEPASGPGPEPASSPGPESAPSTGNSPGVMPEGDSKTSGSDANVGDQKLPELPATESD